MSRKPQFNRYRDTEGYVHASGSYIAVNRAVCANNDDGEATDDPVDCRACLAVIDHVHKHRRPA